MNDLLIKICGITSEQDALDAAEAGADALGFMFYEKSKRFLTPRDAMAIIRKLPPGIRKVGVFVNPSSEAVREAIRESGVDTLQFHGEESAAFCQLFGLPAWKAIQVADGTSLGKIAQFQTEAILLDAFLPGELGGTGTRFDWNLALEGKKTGKRIILAGGLTPENVAEAVSKVQPFGIDVSSGVETAPGRKDKEKIKAFIYRARDCLKII